MPVPTPCPVCLRRTPGFHVFDRMCVTDGRTGEEHVVRQRDWPELPGDLVARVLDAIRHGRRTVDFTPAELSAVRRLRVADTRGAAV
jgi:hypothetical protein